MGPEAVVVVADVSYPASQYPREGSRGGQRKSAEEPVGWGAEALGGSHVGDVTHRSQRYSSGCRGEWWSSLMTYLAVRCSGSMLLNGRRRRANTRATNLLVLVLSGSGECHIVWEVFGNPAVAGLLPR